MFIENSCLRPKLSFSYPHKSNLISQLFVMTRSYLIPGTCSRLFTFIELRENLTRLGANLKQSLIESARKTWESINEFARAHSTQGPDEQDGVVEEATEAIGK